MPYFTINKYYKKHITYLGKEDVYYERNINVLEFLKELRIPTPSFGTCIGFRVSFVELSHLNNSDHRSKPAATDSTSAAV